MKREPEVLARLSAEISHSLANYTVVDADVIIDEARRLMYMVQFSGAGMDECVKRLVVPDPAVEVARRFAGFSIEECEIIITTVRSALWSVAFADLADTHFGRLFKQHQLDHSAHDAPKNIDGWGLR